MSQRFGKLGASEIPHQHKSTATRHASTPTIPRRACTTKYPPSNRRGGPVQGGPRMAKRRLAITYPHPIQLPLKVTRGQHHPGKLYVGGMFLTACLSSLLLKA